MKRYDAILFDLDGTLIDSFDGIVEIFMETLREFDRADVLPERIRSLIGVPLDQCFARFLPEEFVSKATARYRRTYQRRMLAISPEFPGCRGLLDAAKSSGMRLAVVSNKRAIAVRAIVEAKRWPIDAVVAEGEGLAAKPAPDMLLRALSHLEVEAEKALYVGDSDLDALAAERAGLDFAAVTTGVMQAEDFAGLPCVSLNESLGRLRESLGI